MYGYTMEESDEDKWDIVEIGGDDEYFGPEIDPDIEELGYADLWCVVNSNVIQYVKAPGFLLTMYWLIIL